jgi:hypothetical protein
VDAVLQPGAFTHQPGAAGAERAEALGVGVGVPHGGEILRAEQLRQHLGIHLVGLDLGLGDGAGQERVGDHGLGDEGSQGGGHGPAVGGGFQGELVVRAEVFAREGGEAGAGAGEGIALQHLAAGVHDAGFRRAAVDVQTDETFHLQLAPRELGCAAG